VKFLLNFNQVLLRYVPVILSALILFSCKGLKQSSESHATEFGIEINCTELDASRNIMTGITMRHFYELDPNIRIATISKDASGPSQRPASVIYQNDKMIVRILYEFVKVEGQSKSFGFRIYSNEDVSLDIIGADRATIEKIQIVKQTSGS